MTPREQRGLAIAGSQKLQQRGKIWLVPSQNGKGTYTFKGACTSVRIGSGKNTVKIESVDSLDVGGGENKVTVGTVGSIKLAGAKNVVRWKKAKTGDKPTVDDGAAGNDVAHAK